MTHSAWQFYNLSSGLFTGVSFKGPEAVMHLNQPVGCGAIEGVTDWRSQRVDIATGQLVEYQPDTPSAEHDWNPAAKRWQLNATVQAATDRRLSAQGRIEYLERKKLRPLGELALNPTSAVARERLQAIEDEIAQLRKDLE